MAYFNISYFFYCFPICQASQKCALYFQRPLYYIPLMDALKNYTAADLVTFNFSVDFRECPVPE